MTNRQTPETLLLSAMINTGDLSPTTQYHVTPEKFSGYKEEFAWVLDYQARFGKMPSEEHLLAAYPGFPISEDEVDPRWPAYEISEAFARREAMKAIFNAGKLLQQEKTGEAIALLQSVTYAPGLKAPKSLKDDPGYLDEYTAPSELRVPVPWVTLQNHTNGIGPGEIWYLPARPMQGKSHFLIEIAVEAALMGAKVMFISLEMTRRQCQVRYHAAMAHKLGFPDVDALAMLRREYPLDKYRALLEHIAAQPTGELDIHDLSEGFASPSTVARYASDYDLVIVDYVGLMRADSGSRSIDDWRTAATISNALKEVAMSRQTRIIAATQINREGDNHHPWRPPKLRHLSQTDALAQDGDVVVTLRKFGRMSSVLSLEKNRHGESARTFYTHFDPNVGDFDEITREEADMLRELHPLEDD